MTVAYEKDTGSKFSGITPTRDLIAITGALSSRPEPDRAVFTSEAYGFQDAALNWYVIEPSTGNVWRASISGRVLSKVASGSATWEPPIGWTAGNANILISHEPFGTWDFTNATVSGIAAYIANALLTTRGDLIRRGATAPERLALGVNRRVVTSNATDAVYADPFRYQSVTYNTDAACAVGARQSGVGAWGNPFTVPVPSGKTFKLWYIDILIETGATVGSNYDLEGGIVTWPAGTYTQVLTLLNQSNGTRCYFDSAATDINTPLYSVAGPLAIQPFLGIIAGSTGASAANNNAAHIVFSIE